MVKCVLEKTQCTTTSDLAHFDSIKLSGTWNGGVKGSWSKDTKDFPSGTQLTLWEMEVEDFSSKAYRLSDYALTFNCTYS
jgi:hypothetical protein